MRELRVSVKLVEDVLESVEDESAVAALARWAAEQDRWVQFIARSILGTREPINSDVLAETMSTLLREKGLQAGDFPELPDVVEFDASVASKPITISQLITQSDVNAIQDKEVLDFNSRLTVVYGENGSGKSGYARVLKQAAGARTAEKVLPNVYKKAPGIPSADIVYEVEGEKAVTVKWKNDGPINPINSIAVFDNKCAQVHVADDLTFTYVPSELQLFGLVHEGIRAARDELEQMVNERKQSITKILGNFSRGSAIYREVELLTASSDLVTLREIAEKSSAEAADNLRTQLAGLHPDAIRRTLTSIGITKRLLETGRSAVEAIRRFAFNEYSNCLESMASARDALENSGKLLLEGSSLPGVPSEEWERFVMAGNEYLSEHMHEGYPHESDVCIYCEQPFSSAESRERIGRIHSYLSDNSRKAIDDESKKIDGLAMAILSLDLDNFENTLAIKSEDEEDWSNENGALIKVVGLAIELKQRIDEHLGIETPNMDELAAVSDHAIEALQNVADEEIALQKSLEEINQRRAATELAIKEADDALALRRLLPEIESYVETEKWLALAKRVIERIQPVLRSLTDREKEVSASLVNRDFGRIFSAESAKLKTKPVTLEFPGREGATKRHKAIAKNYALDDVLSEGELKVIALADFVSELQLNPSLNPVVFDDPITSLDQPNADLVAKRLVELSFDRQVIIFTHNLYFVSVILSFFTDSGSKDSCTFLQVDSEEAVTGLVSGGNPRIDTPKSVAKRVTAALERAKPLHGDDRQREIRTAYEEMRTWIEVFVEDSLLQGVVKRLRENLMLGNVDKITAESLQLAKKDVFPLFDKASRYIRSHSQTMERLSSQPDLEEAEGDWKTLQTAWKQFNTSE